MLRWQHFFQGALGQKIQFFVQNGIFLLQNVFMSDFLARIRNQRLRIDLCAKFQLNWTKDKRARILTWTAIPKTGWWRHTYLLVMTWAKFLWFLRDFVPEYHHAKFGCNWTTNKGETEGRGGGGGTMLSYTEAINNGSAYCFVRDRLLVIWLLLLKQRKMRFKPIKSWRFTRFFRPIVLFLS